MPSFRNHVIEDGLPRLRLTSIPAVYMVYIDGIEGTGLACPLAVLKTTAWWSEVANASAEGEMDSVSEQDDDGNLLYAVFVNARARKECLQLDIYINMRCVLRGNPRYKANVRRDDTPARVEVRVANFTMRKDSRCAWVYFACDDDEDDEDTDT